MDYIDPGTLAFAKDLIREQAGYHLRKMHIEQIAVRALQEDHIADGDWIKDTAHKYWIRQLRYRLKRIVEGSLPYEALNEMAQTIANQNREKTLRKAGYDPSFSYFWLVEEFKAFEELFGKKAFYFLKKTLNPEGVHPLWAAQFMRTVEQLGPEVIKRSDDVYKLVTESELFPAAVIARKQFREKVADHLGVTIIEKPTKPKKPKLTLVEKPVEEDLATLIQQIRSLEMKAFGEYVLTDKMIAGIAKQATHTKRDTDIEWILKQLHAQKNAIEQQKSGGSHASPALSQTGKNAGKPVIPGLRLEVTIKFDTKPLFRSVAGTKKVFFQVECEGFIWDVHVNRKSANKAMEILDGPNPWTGIVKGTLGEETAKGFVLENAGLQVFERQSED